MIAYEKHKGESEMAKYMIIDGIRADFDQEKISCRLSTA